MGIGDFRGVFTDFNFGNDIALFVFHSGQFIYTAKDRLASGRNQPLADAEDVNLSPLPQKTLNDIFVQGVGRGNLALRPAGIIQHFPGFLRQVGHITGVQTNAALGKTSGLQHLVEGTNGIGNTAFQGIVGIHQQGGVIGVDLTVGLERLILGGEHLDPGMSHGTAGRHTEELVGNRTGRSLAAADVGCSGTHNSTVGTLGPAGAKLQHSPSLGGTDHTVCLGGNEALVVQCQQQIRLNKLCLNGRSPDRQHGFLGENRRAFGDSINIAGELEVRQILQEILLEEIPAAEVCNVLLGKMQVLNVLHHLLETCGNGKAAAIRNSTEEDVKISNLILIAVSKIPVAHGQFIEIAEHRHIEVAFIRHSKTLFRESYLYYISRLFICKPLQTLTFLGDFVKIVANKEVVQYGNANR